MSSLTLKIDDRTVSAEAGDTVLRAAARAGIEIPSLCAHPELEPSGACRLCVVRIEGMRGFPTSCTTPATEGMVVHTQTPEVVALRREVLKLMLSGHTSPCLVCLHKELCETYRKNPSKAGRTTGCGTCSAKALCKVRDLSQAYEIEDLELPTIYRNLPPEREDPFMDRDYSLCVLCGRCVRVCSKLHDAPAIAMTSRGKEARINTAFGVSHTDSPCSFCGACIDICPNGALSDRHARWRGAPDREADTSCNLCPLGCGLRLRLKDNKVVSAGMTAFTREALICAAGRFVYPQILDRASRLTAHRRRIPDGLIEAAYEEALADAARRLASARGDAVLIVTPPSACREDLFIVNRLATQVLDGARVAEGSRDGERTPVPDGVRAVLSFGDYIDAAQRPEALIVIDAFPSPLADAADAVLAPAILAERDGTRLDSAGRVRRLNAAARPPDGLQPDWAIVRDLARAMGDTGCDYACAADITRELEAAATAQQPPAAPKPSPLEDRRALPRRFRGHSLTAISCALGDVLAEPADGAIGTETASPAPPNATRAERRKRFEITARRELVPNTHTVTVYAPDVARACRPGQFVIGMSGPTSERIPYTPADWDSERGTVTFNVQEAGRSSRELIRMQPGDCMAHFAGPLGRPAEIERYGTVLLGGGCYGVGAMLPLARALKTAGNRVLCAQEASSSYLLYWQDRLAEAADELLIATKDGTQGTKGGVQEIMDLLVERGETIDQAFISGCPFMMMLVCETAGRRGIPTFAALNSIMLDGTGMCGACRVSVDGETRFACVDGPYMDGLKVDWLELMQRRAAYAAEEVQALPDQHKHRCMTV